MNVPDGLPTLSGGAHDPHQGKGCFMEYASLLAGEEWSDSPACTHPVIAGMARTVNDLLPDSERHLIADLIPSVIGTADTREDETERRVLSARLAVWCAKQVAHLAPDPAVAWRAIAAAEAWADNPCGATADAAADAARAARAAALTEAGYAARAYAAAYAAAAAAADAAAARPAAYAAYAAADLPALLRGLIAEHARLTCHTINPHTQAAWENADFAELVR